MNKNVKYTKCDYKINHMIMIENVAYILIIIS